MYLRNFGHKKTKMVRLATVKVIIKFDYNLSSMFLTLSFRNFFTGDGIISWEEFSGPKGDSPMGDEL